MRSGLEIARRTSGWLPPFLLRPLGRPAAVLFHGVVPALSDPRIEINHHQIDSFRAIAIELKRSFEVLPIDAVAEALAQPRLHGRSIFLMADDGYANTLEVAADVLAELRLPWTLFISTEHIETGALNPLILARLFVHFAPAGRYAIPNLSGSVRLGSEEERSRLVGPFLSQLRALPMTRARETIAALERAFPAGLLDKLRARAASERYLRWNQVEDLHRRGVTIGAHAHWHWPMNAAQNADELHIQATRPRELIAARLGACRYFAYPFGNSGDISPVAREAVRKAGYTHAFTTFSGTLHQGRDPWFLPRYGLNSREPNLPSLLPLLRMADLRNRAEIAKRAGPPV